MEILDDEYIYSDSDEEDVDYIPEVSTSDVENITNFLKNYETNVKNNKTSNILSKYEKTRILSERAQQIEDGSPPYIVNFERFNSSYAIAIEELNQKKIPFIIRRTNPHLKYFEYWKLKDMIY